MSADELSRIPHGLKSCLVHVTIGPHNEQRDHVSNLLLKQAKEVLKDALVACAERHDGVLNSWKDHSGTFMFLADGPNGYNDCCLAAVQMLDQLLSVNRGVRLSENLKQLIAIRIVCDVGPVVADRETSTVANELIEAVNKHGLSVTVSNRVVITDRVFHQLKEPLKSRFVKSNCSVERGIDYYANTDHPPGVVSATGSHPDEAEPSAVEQTTQATAVPTRGGQSSSTGKRVLGSFGARAAVIPGAVVVSCLAILAVGRLWPALPVGQSTAALPQYPELVQTDGWRAWRHQVHERLSSDGVTEAVLADTLKLGLPARPEHAGAALRRDQAIGEVLMSYPPVRKILWDRFGIDEENFLGTGLSKPSTASNNYGAAAVHEYLIRNYYSDSQGVWMRTLDPINNPDALRMTVAELFDGDSKIGPTKKEIAQRVKDRDPGVPAVIRFARFNAAKYSRKLGPPNRRFVFASNLAEVWNLSVKDAANLSGYISGEGDTVYIWVFLPNHAADIVPATWDQVLNHLPAWLGEDKN